MKKLLIITLVLVAFAFQSKVNAQNVLDGIYPKEHVLNHKPIPYPHVREADVMWAKKVWRIIDLREKMNLSLYYPLQAMDGRYSLISLLLNGITYEGLTAYSAAADDEFKVPMSVEAVNQEMGAIADTIPVEQEDGTIQYKYITGDVRTDEIKQVMVKEVWFFDRNYSRMDVRIIGLCPIREMVEEKGGEMEVKKKQVFWVYFPQAREYLARHEVFNTKNDAQRRTFDDIFIKRYFASYIVKESNVYNNRQIDNYAVGMDAMMESERIKNDIFTFEHDLWEF